MTWFHLAVLSLQNPLLPFSLLGTLSLGLLFQATVQCPVVTRAHPFGGNHLQYILPYCHLSREAVTGMPGLCVAERFAFNSILFFPSFPASGVESLRAGSVLFVLCLVNQWCLTLCDPMDYSLPGSSVHRILQARVLACHALLHWIFLTQDQTEVSVISCIGS